MTPVFGVVKDPSAWGDALAADAAGDARVGAEECTEVGMEGAGGADEVTEGRVSSTSGSSVHLDFLEGGALTGETATDTPIN